MTAVEPSATMRALRPADLPEAVEAVVENLPFPDGTFDAAMATFSIHQWSDLERGLSEMRRVTTGPLLILTCDPVALDRFWLYDYCPEVIDTEARRYPTAERITAALGKNSRVISVPVPIDCTDRFSEAYYARPEGLLDPGARLANSAWSFVAPEVVARFERALRGDLEQGRWDERYGALRLQPEFDGSLRLFVGFP